MTRGAALEDFYEISYVVQREERSTQTVQRFS
jgi:hypothetical protein